MQRRLATSLILTLIAVGLVHAQSWDKLVAPGLTYRMVIDASGPRVVHALRWTPKSPDFGARSEVSGLRIFNVADNKGREELTAMASRAGALGGINGDFFPFTGDPLGAMIRNGELISRPDPRRGVFVWGSKVSPSIAKLQWTCSVLVGDKTFAVNGLNEECGPDMIVLNTDGAAASIAKAPCTFVRLTMGDGKMRANSVLTATVVNSGADQESVPVQAGQAILVGRGVGAEKLKALTPGSKVTITTVTKGLPDDEIEQAISGGPTLLASAKPAIDWKAAGFQDAFANHRHPRTAIGVDAKGDIWMVAVDGRQPHSVGATLDEMAKVMSDLGCIQALNLDGGGSTTIALYGLILNKPSDGPERKIANGVLIFGQRPKPTDEPMAVKGPRSIVAEKSARFAVVSGSGEPIRNSEILWSASGDAWIDQGGTLHATQIGSATIKAFVRGRTVSLKVVVEKGAAK